MHNSTKAKGREVYAQAEHIDDLLSAYNAIEDQILDMAKAMGDKAPQGLSHCAGGVRARREHAYSTFAEHARQFGQPFADYTVIPAPNPGWSRRWRLRLLHSIAARDTWRIKRRTVRDAVKPIKSKP